MQNKRTDQKDAELKIMGVFIFVFLGILAVLAVMTASQDQSSVVQLLGDASTPAEKLKKKFLVVIPSEIEGMEAADALALLKEESGIDFATASLSPDEAAMKIDFSSKGKTVKDIIGSMVAQLSKENGKGYVVTFNEEGKDVQIRQEGTATPVTDIPQVSPTGP